LIENVNVWGISKYDIFCEGPIQMAHCKNIKLSFGMHPQLNNMNLKNGMVIKGV
jgi:hypothetical protein